MHSKIFVFILALALGGSCMAQVRPAAEGSQVNLSAGGGLDYWQGDYTGVSRFGPCAWITDEFWHGMGVNIEGHSMIIGGSYPSASYKYFVGEGGFIYNYHHFQRLTPFAKAELGFASLSFPHKTGAKYTHDTRNTWALGGGIDYKLSRHLSARIDYTYDAFPNFYSTISGQHHTLNPNGISFGPTYHFR